MFVQIEEVKTAQATDVLFEMSSSRVKKHDNVCDVLAIIRPMAKHVSLPDMLFDISSCMLHKEPFRGTHNQQSMNLDSWR